MRHRVKKLTKIGSNKEHSLALVRNLVISVIIHEKVATTLAKARAALPLLERVIATAKKQEGQNAFRGIEKYLQHDNAAKKTMEVLKPRYADRVSGFARLIRLGNRKGDNAELVQLELIQK